MTLGQKLLFFKDRHKTSLVEIILIFGLRLSLAKALPRARLCRRARLSGAVIGHSTLEFLTLKSQAITFSEPNLRPMHSLRVGILGALSTKISAPDTVGSPSCRATLILEILASEK